MAENGYTTREGWHVTDDGVKLYTKTWKASYSSFPTLKTADSLKA